MLSRHNPVVLYVQIESNFRLLIFEDGRKPEYPWTPRSKRRTNNTQSACGSRNRTRDIEYSVAYVLIVENFFKGT